MADVEDKPKGAEEEEEEEEMPPIEKRTDILYCGACSVPPEYCVFNPPNLYADCLRWQNKNHPELLPEGASLEDLLSKLKIKGDGDGGGSDAAGRGGEGGEGGEEGAGEDEEGGGEKKKKVGSGGPKGLKKKDAGGAGGKVVITRMSRNKRKSVTIVTGLDTYPELKLKDIAKALSKTFACSASVSDTASGGKEIVIQGDVLDPLAELLEEKYQVPGDKIVLKA